MVLLFPSSEQIIFNKQPLKCIFLRLIIYENKCNIYFITNLIHQSNSASIFKCLVSVFCSEEAVIQRLKWGKTKLFLISYLMKITGSLWILMLPDLPQFTASSILQSNNKNNIVRLISHGMNKIIKHNPFNSENYLISNGIK